MGCPKVGIQRDGLLGIAERLLDRIPGKRVEVIPVTDGLASDQGTEGHSHINERFIAVLVGGLVDFGIGLLQLCAIKHMRFHLIIGLAREIPGGGVSRRWLVVIRNGIRPGPEDDKTAPEHPG